MMRLHPDTTSRIPHRITHLDDAPWRLPHRSEPPTAIHHANRNDGAALCDHPSALLAPSCRRQACALANLVRHARLARRHRYATVAPRRSPWAGLGRATAGPHREAAANHHQARHFTLERLPYRWSPFHAGRGTVPVSPTGWGAINGIRCARWPLGSGWPATANLLLPRL